MSLTSIYAIAKSIQPFIKGGGTITLEGVYKIIMTNTHLEFIKKIISLNNIPVLVFVTYEIANGNHDETIVGKVKNNLFGFNTFEFGDTVNNVDCDECGGSGEHSCDYCDGNGYQSCDECDRTGEVDCDECGGYGEDEEGNSCNECQGGGKLECSNCSGEGTVDCDQCSNGNVGCEKCDLNGSIEIHDTVPYVLSQYVSYDLKLHDELQSLITQNKDIDSNLNDKTLTIFTIEYLANDGEAEDVNLEYANKNYIGRVIDIEDSTITLRRDKLFIFDLDYLEERFEK